MNRYTTFFHFCTHSMEIIDMFSDLTITLALAFFVDTVYGRSLKLCTINTWLGVYQFIPGVMILTLFQGYSYVRTTNCKLFSNKFLSTVV